MSPYAALSLLITESSAGPCHTDHPCEDTYPFPVVDNNLDVVEVGVLVSVDLDEPWALAARKLIEITIDQINDDER